MSDDKTPEIREEARAEDRVPAAYLDLVRTLSHEVRTPLSTIIGFADMMEHELLGAIGHAGYRDYAADICKAARSILETLNDVSQATQFQRYTAQQNDFQQLIELAPDLICMVREGKIEMINPAGAGMLEVWPPKTLIGRPFVDCLRDDCRAMVKPDLSDLIEVGTRVPLTIQRADGVHLDVEVSAVPYHSGESDNGPTDSIMVVARDVTERNRAISAASERETNLTMVMDAVGDGIISVDEKGRIESVNIAIAKMFKYNSGTLIGKPIDLLLANFTTETLSAIAEAGTTSPMSLETPPEAVGQTKDGETFPVELIVTKSAFGERMRYVAAVRDITRRKVFEDRLRKLATEDPLTGLANKNLLTERLKEAMTVSDADNHSAAVMYIDLDQFQNINNAFGHEVGDAVICAAARRIRSCVRDDATVARIGGDDFEVLIPKIEAEGEEEDLAGDLLVALSSPFTVDGREIFSSASIGVARYPEHGATTSELMRNVDTAVNHAKRKGRANYKVYTPEMSEVVQRRVELGHHLRRALETNELSLNYQPKVDLKSRRVTGAEALLRWHSAELGFVSPAEFIPIAEETGLIVAIGDWVLRTACIEAASWPRHQGAPVQVSVNLSALQFTHGDIVARVRSSLYASGLPPERLDLELTESLLVEQPEETIRTLRQLKSMGISISMDDFGTGYSSLSYLTKFPLDSLKVDRAFVTDLPDDKDAVVVVRAIIGMAKELDLHIVAEGIETEDQMSFLDGLGCQTGQGYLFSKPLPLFEFEAMLAPQAAE